MGDWSKLRAVVGAGPVWPVFPTKRRHLDEMESGERLLVIRKHGGLGDMLMTTMLFGDLQEQHPNIEMTYAVPRHYFPLFEGNTMGLKVIAYEELYGPKDGQYGPDGPQHKAGLQNWIYDEFELVEDISFPCRLWEQLMIKHDTIYGERGLRWRNRIDRWSRWMGFEVKHPTTIIRLNQEEVQGFRSRFHATSRPVLVWSPISAKPNRSYPWHKEVKGLLEKEGFKVLYLHHESLGVDSLHGRSLRDMGAAIQAADFVLSVDTATFHWGGILLRPTLGLFNLLLGESHAKYYPTASTLQLCDTPCIAARYENPVACEKWAEPNPMGLSRCFQPDSVEQIVRGVKWQFMR